ncbi:MAG: S41 family peptidase [Clostridiales bacterium]|nr:S41 family peptidase [Clostridiales bacterium]
MKKEIKGFVIGSISTLMLSSLVYAGSQVANVFLSPFDIKLNGKEYVSQMPVLNYQGRTYLALRELGTVLGDEIDFKDDTIIINSKNDEKISNDITKLDAIYTIIKESYYGQYSEDALEEGAIKGLVNALGDKYSVYMNEEEYKDLMTETEGEYTGIGLYLTIDETKNLIQVISPIKGSPSSLVDIKPEDYIIEIDGVKYTGDDLDKATNYIKTGEAGTFIELTIQRGNKTFKVKVERKIIELYELEYEVIENNIGYINIKSFDKNTYSDFYDAYFALLNKGVKGIIVDLRNNPGGLLYEVLNICDILIPEGNNIISTIDAKGEKTEFNSVKGYIDIPMVVLVNEGSASASEIMASCLQDNGIAKIVGTTTFGKGVVQSLLPIADGTGLKLTTSEYFRANGNKIHGIGVIPDYIIENTNVNKDNQLKKAIDLLK